MGWTYEQWEQADKGADWGTKVVDALKHYFDEGRWLLEPAELVDAGFEVDPDGVSVLLAVYDHPYSPKRIGLRRRLDKTPLTSGAPGAFPEEAVAADIAVFEISEPLGRYYDLLVEDSTGVWPSGVRSRANDRLSHRPWGSCHVRGHGERSGVDRPSRIWDLRAI